MTEEQTTILKSRTEFAGWNEWLEYLAERLHSARQEELELLGEVAVFQFNADRVENTELMKGYAEGGSIDGKNSETRKRQEEEILFSNEAIETANHELENVKRVYGSHVATRQYYEDLLKIGHTILRTK